MTASEGDQRRHLCLVCGILVKRKADHQPKNCDGCKKFFLRYSSKQGNLKCYNGDNRCVVKSSLLTGFQICTKCRFDKCIKAGMTSKRLNAEDNNNLPANNCRTERSQDVGQKAVLPFVKDPAVYDGSAVEQMLRMIVEAYTTFHGLNFLPLANFDDTIRDSAEFHKQASVHLRNAIETFLSYAKFVASHEGMDDKDIAILRRKFMVAPGVFHCLPGHENNLFLGVHNNFVPHVLRIHPCLLNLYEVFKQLQALLSAWDPSFLECAILFGLLFFNDDGLHTEKLARARRRVWLALQLMRTSKKSPNETLTDESAGESEYHERQKKLFERCLLSIQQLIAATHSTTHDQRISFYLHMALGESLIDNT